MLTDDAQAFVDEERPEASREGWRIETLVDADWALRRIRELETEREEIEAMLQARVLELKTRADALKAKADRGISFFSAHLQLFAENHRDELLKGSKKKSRALLHGSIGWRKAGGKARKLDESALLEWAKAQPADTGFVRVKEEPAWSEIKAHVEATGEDVPGVELEPERDEFIVKTEAGRRQP